MIIQQIQHSSRLFPIALALVLGPIEGAVPVSANPVHDLDPYPVEANALWSAPERGDLFNDGRLLLASDGDSRSGVWIPEDLLEATGAARLEDFFWQIPGAATQARFGVITVPTIRGDAAESLYNGQRRGDNLFGLAPTLTAVESVEVITGATLLKAGLGKRTGGMLNMSTKRPVIGQVFGQLELRLGTWVPGGGSFRTIESTLDLNLPVGRGQAIRLAAGFRDDETFYHRNGGHDDYTDLYAAWRLEKSNGGSVDLIAYYHRAERPQTLGVNRPWQGLIDDNLYVTGDVDSSIGLSDPPGVLDPGVADPGLLTGGRDDLIHLSPDRVLMSIGDTGPGEAYLGQAIYNEPLNPDLAFQQLLLVERVFRDKLNQFFFAEDVEQLTLDSVSRLLGQSVNEMGVLDWSAGLHLRQEERNNRANYWNEFAYAFDLSEGRSFSTPEQFAAYLAPGSVESADGRSWYLPSSFFSTPESTDSRLRQAGLYGEVTQALGSSWRVSASLRVDWMELRASEPGDLGLSNRLSDEETIPLGSGSIRIQRLLESGGLYLTAGIYRGVAGNTVGDGLNLYEPGELHRDDFLNRTRLLEIGGQHELAPSLDFSWALFDQERQRKEFFGSNDIEVRGLEVSMAWQAATETRLVINGHFLDANYVNAAPAEFGGGSLWNVYAPGTGPTAEGNGLGYIGGFFLNSVPPGDYRIPGLSKWQVNAGLEQSIGERWTLWIWGGWASEQTGNLAAEYVIPSQMEWNASLSYTINRWDIQLIARNLLDAENWIHNGDTFFDQMLVSRNLPLRLEGRIRIRF